MATVAFRVEGLKGVIDTLKQLPPEVVSKRGGPVRAALRKAAVVIQKQEIENLQAIILEPNKDSSDRSTGLLEKNIVVSRSRFRNGANGERYLVRVRRKVYPGQAPKSNRRQKGAKNVVTSQVARLLEYGTVRRTPRPFIRPAFDAKKQEAVDTFVTETNKGIERIVKKLERQNRVKS